MRIAKPHQLLNSFKIEDVEQTSEKAAILGSLAYVRKQELWMKDWHATPWKFGVAHIQVFRSPWHWKSWKAVWPKTSQHHHKGAYAKLYFGYRQQSTHPAPLLTSVWKLGTAAEGTKIAFLLKCKCILNIEHALHIFRWWALNRLNRSKAWCLLIKN